jgi:hypothetical protein
METICVKDALFASPFYVVKSITKYSILLISCKHLVISHLINQHWIIIRFWECLPLGKLNSNQHLVFSHWREYTT